MTSPNSAVGVFFSLGDIRRYLATYQESLAVTDVFDEGDLDESDAFKLSHFTHTDIRLSAVGTCRVIGPICVYAVGLDPDNGHFLFIQPRVAPFAPSYRPANN